MRICRPEEKNPPHQIKVWENFCWCCFSQTIKGHFTSKHLFYKLPQMVSKWHQHLRFLLAKISNVEQQLCLNFIFANLLNYVYKYFMNLTRRVAFGSPAPSLDSRNLNMYVVNIFYRFANAFCLWFDSMQRFCYECFSHPWLFDSFCIHWMWHCVHCCISQSNNLHSFHCTFL